MKFRLGLTLAGSIVFAIGCAGGGGGGAAPPAPGGVEPAPGGGDELQIGESVRNNEMTRAAADQLEQAAEATDPGQAEGMYGLALDASEQAITADPRNPLAWYLAGRASIGLGQYAEADSLLSQATELRPIYQLEIDPMREQAWLELYNTAQPLANAGEYEEAATLLEGAHAIYKARPEAMVVLGQVYGRLGRPEEAIPLLEQALEIINSAEIEEVDSVTAAGWRAQAEDVIPLTMTDMYIQAQQYDQAAQKLRELIAEDPDNLVLQQNLASIYLELEQPDSASAVYGRLLQRSDLKGSDYFQIGAGFYNLDENERAEEAFRRAYEYSEYDRDALDLLVSVIQLQNQPGDTMPEPEAGVLEELLELSKAWTELDPNNQRAYLVAAQTAQRLERQEEARELITAADELEVTTRQVEFRPSRSGGTVYGFLSNESLEPGTEVTITFTVYGTSDTPIGTGSATVSMPDQGGLQNFQVPFQTEEEIAGYTYEINTM